MAEVHAPITIPQEPNAFSWRITKLKENMGLKAIVGLKNEENQITYFTGTINWQPENRWPYSIGKKSSSGEIVNDFPINPDKLVFLAVRIHQDVEINKHSGNVNPVNPYGNPTRVVSV